jgi:ribosomal protein L11
VLLARSSPSGISVCKTFRELAEEKDKRPTNAQITVISKKLFDGFIFSKKIITQIIKNEVKLASRSFF